MSRPRHISRKPKPAMGASARAAVTLHKQNPTTTAR